MSSHPQIDPSGVEEAASALWKNELLDRLAAHRSRRGRHGSALDSRERLLTPEAEDPNRAARIAAAIAERFARQPSYRDLMAAEEAEHQRLAEEEAKVETERLAAVQQALLDAPPEAETQPQSEGDILDARRRYIETSHRVVLHAPIPGPLPHQERSRAESDDSAKQRISRAELEDIIQSVLVEPTVPLPAKLLEFPRELIAPRKARPRIVEGFLLQEPDAETAVDAAERIRIFEVESEGISHQPLAADSAIPNAPVWSSIRLDDYRAPRWQREAPAAASLGLPLQPAPLSRRALASAIDAAYVAAAFAGFAAVFVFTATSAPVPRLAAEFGVAVFVLLFAIYQWMFFTYAQSTPGMRVARIALCTFEDTNPTRRAMRLRLGALMLSACPLGLGFLWSIIDVDRLGWHDRIAHMYQRSY